MRRLVLVAVLSSLAAVPALSGPLTLGVRGGSSIPDLRDNSSGNDFSSGWSTRVAPYFGMIADWGLRGSWSLQAEVNWASQGGRRNGMQRVEDSQLEALVGGQPLYARFDNVAKLDYIEVPLLLKYTLGGPRGLSLMAGPYAGLLISAKTVTSGTSTVYMDKGGTQPVLMPPTSEPLVVDFDAVTDNKSDLHEFNWGVQAGVGAARRLGIGQVTLDVRAGLGLANIQKDTATNGKNSTGNVVIAAGYSLPIAGTR